MLILKSIIIEISSILSPKTSQMPNEKKLVDIKKSLIIN